MSKGGKKHTVIVNGKRVSKVKGATQPDHVEFDADNPNTWTDEYKWWLIQQLRKESK